MNQIANSERFDRLVRCLALLEKIREDVLPALNQLERSLLRESITQHSKQGYTLDEWRYAIAQIHSQNDPLPIELLEYPPQEVNQPFTD